MSDFPEKVRMFLAQPDNEDLAAEVIAEAARNNIINLPKKVWVLTVDHQDGFDVYLSYSEKGIDHTFFTLIDAWNSVDSLRNDENFEEAESLREALMRGDREEVHEVFSESFQGGPYVSIYQEEVSR